MELVDELLVVAGGCIGDGISAIRLNGCDDLCSGAVVVITDFLKYILCWNSMCLE